MRKRRRWSCGTALVGAALLAVSSAPSGAGAVLRTELPARPGASGQAIDGITTDAAVAYQVDPAAGAVHVTTVVTLTNEQPDQRVPGGVRQFFLDQFAVPVVAEATGVVATRSDGTPLDVDRDTPDNPFVAAAVVDLSPNLFYPDTQTIELRYDIPSSPPRSQGATRVNGAFVTFPAFALGDPGRTDISISVPAGFEEVEVVGSEMERTELDGGAVELAAVDIADPEGFFATLVARDDDALIARQVEVEGTTVTIRAWPGDEAWADFAADTTGRGAPQLAELIGLPWPGGDELEVIESASPYAYGYSGWYLPLEAAIEVGDDLDSGVLLHELSHLWFNDELFASRWINEGFAEHFSARAVGRLGTPAAAPEPPSADHPGRIALNDWSDPDPQEPAAEDRERYGYTTSYAVIDRLAQELGPDRLAQVVQAAADMEIAYQGGGEPLRYLQHPGWKALLDLVEEVGGSAGAVPLFAELVVNEAERPLLDERAAARAAYDALEAAGEGWSPPAAVRREMADWRFVEAMAAIPRATAALAVRAEVTSVLGAVDVGLPAAVESTYEGARDLDQLDRSLAQALDASRELVDAIEAERASSGPLDALGLLLTGAAGDVQAARRALESGDYAEAAQRAASAERAYERATAAGAQRAFALLIIVIVGAVVVHRVRHRRTVRPVDDHLA